MRSKLALLAMILLAQNATAQPVVILPDTVVTATRNPLPVTNIPAGVTAIDRQAIQSSGATTLADVLATVPGLHVSPSGGPGGQASVFMRGTNSGHVLVLRDGMPINDASEVSGAFNFGVDTLSDIERIEVVRGPMAALYGSGAVGGVVNLISRRGTEGAPRLEMDLSGGYPETIVGSAFAGGTIGPFDYAVTAESQSKRGFDSTPQRMRVYTGTPQGFRDRIATVNLGYTPVDGTRLSLFLRARQTLFGFNSLGSPTFDTANSSGQTASLMGRIGGTSRLFGGAYETGLFLGRTQDNRRYLQVLNLADPNLTAQDNRYHAYRTDLQWNNTVHLNDLFPSDHLTATDLTFGYQHTIDTINVKVNDSFSGFPFRQAARASMTTDAGHAGLTTTFRKHLIMTAQVRQDWVGGNTPTTWRVGSVLDVPLLRTSFKAAYGTSFRAPSLFQRFGIDSFSTIGNPALKPESAEGWELGFTTKLPVLGREDAVTFGATFFSQQVRDLIVGVFVPVATSVNLGSARIQGVEAEITLRPAAWLTLHGSYTFTDATAVGQSAATGSALLRRPRHAAEADLTVMPMPGLRIVSQLIYTGPAHDFLYGNSGSGIGFGVGQQGLVANMTAAYDVTPKVQLHLDGTNIFNSRFEPVNGFQMPGTTVLAGVRMRW
ncbi:MAG: TonB-dependent receptor [Acetobacteraceae bacterium]|nr:TonB-dependent receptor [Acetobacteraceae bacterium]